ncbi:hypothetical protein AB0H43_13145 [Hamadaea sp. NPDC050747]|uniref:hypothetical protein n=1 Tax=Hamadaea sp. NPDC050747 TaxID=3155789 RepID=UPI0033D4A3AE
MSEPVTAVILGTFALVTVVLVQARQLMREIRRTVEEWRRLRNAIRDMRMKDVCMADDEPTQIEP